jgi:dienelactone hydrolase
MQRRQLFAAIGGLAAAALSGPARARSWPAEDETWTDGARGRSLPMRLRWPDGLGPCGAIVHSHGLGGNRDGGDAWGQAWRDAGFLVLHVQHPGSDTDAFRHGGMGTLREATRPEQLVARVADMHFVIDEIERRARSGGHWSRVRLDAIGASGHSYGAVTVQAIAGKRYPVATPGFVEPRCRAFVAFSPSPDRNGRLPLAQQFGAIERPFLAITGSLDGDPLRGRGGTELTPESRASVYDGLPAGRRALLWLDGADHMTFGGNAEQRIAARRGPFKREPEVAAREPGHHALVARITGQWWRAHLLGDASAAAALRNPLGLGPGDRWRSD